jgi:hypothetical protein
MDETGVRFSLPAQRTHETSYERMGFRCGLLREGESKDGLNETRSLRLG